jgi:hypothetical protein
MNGVKSENIRYSKHIVAERAFSKDGWSRGRRCRGRGPRFCLGFDNSRVCMLRKAPIGTLQTGTSTSWTCLKAGNRSSEVDINSRGGVRQRDGGSEESFRIDRWGKVVDSYSDRRKVTIGDDLDVVIAMILHRGRHSELIRVACWVRCLSSIPLAKMSIGAVPAWVKK